MQRSFQQLAVEQAIQTLFNKRHFDITLLNEIGEMLGVNPRQAAIYPFLSSLHCVDFSAMAPELRAQLEFKVVECLRPHFNTNALIHALTAEGNGFTPIEDQYIDGHAIQSLSAPKKH